MADVASRQVDWWSVHLLVEPVLSTVCSWPTVGTPVWRELDDQDPVKWAALLDAARHWALQLDTRLAQLVEASHDVAAAADWSQLARNLQQRKGVYIPRRSA